MIDSKNVDFPKGTFVYGMLGCRTNTIFNPKVAQDGFIKPYILPSFGELPLSLGLGHLGVTGNTAYFDFLNICDPKEEHIFRFYRLNYLISYEKKKIKDVKMITFQHLKCIKINKENRNREKID